MHKSLYIIVFTFLCGSAIFSSTPQAPEALTMGEEDSSSTVGVSAGTAGDVAHFSLAQQQGPSRLTCRQKALVGLYVAGVSAAGVTCGCGLPVGVTVYALKGGCGLLPGVGAGILGGMCTGAGCAVAVTSCDKRRA